MSLEAKIFKGVSWVAFFNFFTQVFSWIITIIIARILLPDDYGLMSMATIITGYAVNLSELGLGNAIIQRLHINRKELSSIFWFSMGMTIVMALSCFPVAYITALLMHEPRVIPITETVSLVFILNGLQIIPISLMRREMNFKSLGFMDMVSTIGACGGMFLIAKTGGGVWTLILGSIIRSLIKVTMLYHKTKWHPSWYYCFREAKQYLTFGIPQAIGSSLFYIQEASDRFFAGRAWKPTMLGHYSFAKNLSDLPTQKIVSLVNTVSFPAFSQVQNDPYAFKALYLNIIKVTSMIVLPLFIGGFVLGEDLIKLILTPKWYPIIGLFKLLCLSQILTGLNAINNFVHAARGNPKMSMYYNIACILCMPISFYFAVQKGELNAMAVPWLSTYVILSVGWIIISLHKLEIPLKKYLANLWSPVSGTIIMGGCLLIMHRLKLHVEIQGRFQEIAYLALCILIGIVSYCGYMWFKENKFLTNMLKLIKK